ncbi:hypothetical protein ACO2Q3_17185 [Caulobacter sp. KR2-114]|uniref:hypothetical protein n=1 Tax=Caulobacter sp. KR2-114 TaxID=3400912 RepID=UPI003C0789D1
MRPILTLAALVALAAAGACSRHDQSQAQRDAHNVVADARLGVRKLAASADVAKARAEVRKTADQAKRELKETGDQARAAVRGTAHEVKRKSDS